MNSKARFVSLSLLLLLAACVTINVYFPGPAAEKAANKIINRVWGIPSQKSGKSAPGSAPSAALAPPDLLKFARNALGETLTFVIPDAEAAANFNISTPAIRKIQHALSTLFHQHLEKYFDSGAVGLTNSGLTAVHSLDSVALPRRNEVERLVAKNNAELHALYQQIATANNHPEWRNKVRKTFAKRWIANARSGWYYQTDAGKWVQKK